MADKEATVYIVDVGRSTSRRRNGRSQTDLDWALTYVWDRVAAVIALERKTTLQALIAVRSDDTRNELSEDLNYRNISVIQDLKSLLMQDLRELQAQVSPSNTDNGDAISAIVLAVQLIDKTCKKLKYIRRIVLVTSGDGLWSSDDIGEICSKISEDQIQLTILDISADAKDNKAGLESKLSENQQLMHKLAEGTAGTYQKLSAAIEEMSRPKLKATRPTPSFKGRLCLGDPSQYDDAIMIDIERYPRTMIRKPQTATSVVDQSSTQLGGGTQTSTTLQSGGMDVDLDQPLGLVRGSRVYEIEDKNSENGKKQVSFEDLSKGYEYGRTAVPVSESEWSILNMDASSGFEIVGFVPAENYDRYMGLSRTNVIIAQKNNPRAVMALSSFIRALHEVNSCAVARLVIKDDKPPILLLLAPVIEESGLEYLVDTELPFAEDVRSYRFPPLDHVLTVSGKVLKEHRNIPTASLQSAMDEYVDSMDIDAYASHSSWNPADYAQLNDSFSPLLHRIEAAIRARAVDPSIKSPPASSILTKYSAPPSNLVSQAALDRLKKVSDVKKVPPKQQARRLREVVSTKELDLSAVMAKGKGTQAPPKASSPKVDPQNPIPTFMQMLRTTVDPNGIHDAAAQMSAVIETHARKGFGDLGHNKVLEEMAVLRREMIDMEEPQLYNDWARSFREKLLSEKLGGDRRELWWKVREQGGLGLIVGERTQVSQDDIDAFMSMRL